MPKDSMFRGRGNFHHDSAVYRLKPKFQAMLDRIADMRLRDYKYAQYNDLILVQEKYLGMYHGCIFCKEKTPEDDRYRLYNEYRDTKMEEIQIDNEHYYRCPQCHFIKIKDGFRLSYEDSLEEHFIVGIIGKSYHYEQDLLKAIHIRALNEREVWIKLYQYFKEFFSIMVNKIIIKKWREDENEES